MRQQLHNVQQGAGVPASARVPVTKDYSTLSSACDTLVVTTVDRQLRLGRPLRGKHNALASKSRADTNEREE